MTSNIEHVDEKNLSLSALKWKIKNQKLLQLKTYSWIIPKKP